MPLYRRSLNSILTTPGDMLYLGSNGKLARLPAGGSSALLGIASGLPAWSASGSTTGSGFSAPTAPAAPSEANYTIPAGATVVSNITQLQTALASATAQDIYVQNGSYSRASELVPAAAHRLYGQSVAGVIFNFGLRWNGLVGWKVKGITFDLPDAAHAATDGGFTAAILNWIGSTVTNGEITDCVLDGAGVVAQGVQLGQPGGAVIQRLVISNFTDEGLRLSSNNPASTAAITTVTDLTISNIMRSSRGAADGTAEAALWVGHPVTNTVARVKIRNTGWMGLWTGNACKNTTFSDFDIDQIYGLSPSLGTYTGVGYYPEAWTRSITFQNFWIGHEFGDVITGVNSEWDHGLNAALSGALTLPAATIPIKDSQYDTTNFPASGTLYMGENGESGAIAYTGKTTSSFTGCTGGAGTFSDRTLISTNPTGYQATSYLVVQNGYINVNSTHRTSRYGIVLDEGTRWPTISGVVFVNCSAGCVLDRTGTPHATGPGDSQLVQSGNDFSGRLAGAATIAYG